MQRVAIFFAGFLCGAVCLGLLVWRGNAVHSTSEATASPGTAPAAGEPPVRRKPPAVAHVTASGLLMPVEGVQPHELRDTFNDKRTGHMHEALDILAPRGTAVLAVADGKLAKMFHSKPGGLTIYQFDSTEGWCYYYAHLDRYAEGIHDGAMLRKGEVIGYVGTTGDAPPDVPHLHFAIFKLGPEKHWWQGTAINPYPVLSGELRSWPPE